MHPRQKRNPGPLVALVALAATSLLLGGCGAAATAGPAVQGPVGAGQGLTPPPLEQPVGTGASNTGFTGAGSSLPQLPVEPGQPGDTTPLAGTDSSVASGTGSPAAPVTAATAAGRSQFEAEVDKHMLALLNRERQAAGAGPLRFDGRLHNAAWEHAFDMFKGGYIDHQNKRGEWAHDRAARAGFPMNGSIQNVNENVADIFPRNTPQELATKAMDMYRQSDGHWRNLLNPKWNVVGLATVYRPDQSTKDSYGVPRTPNAQVFGRL